MNGRGQFDVSFIGLSSWIAPSFSFAMVASSASIGFENEIVGDHHAHRKSRPDGDGWLDVSDRPTTCWPV